MLYYKGSLWFSIRKGQRMNKKKITIAIFWVVFSYCIGKKISTIILQVDSSNLASKLFYEFVGVCSIVGIIIVFLLLIGILDSLDTLYSNWKSIRKQKKDRS